MTVGGADFGRRGVCGFGIIVKPGMPNGVRLRVGVTATGTQNQKEGRGLYE